MNDNKKKKSVKGDITEEESEKTEIEQYLEKNIATITPAAYYKLRKGNQESITKEEAIKMLGEFRSTGIKFYEKLVKKWENAYEALKEITD